MGRIDAYPAYGHVRAAVSCSKTWPLHRILIDIPHVNKTLTTSPMPLKGVVKGKSF